MAEFSDASRPRRHAGRGSSPTSLLRHLRPSSATARALSVRSSGSPQRLDPQVDPHGSGGVRISAAESVRIYAWTDGGEPQV